MNATPLDLSGAMIGSFQVTERAIPGDGRGACWWMVCLECKHQFWQRGTSIRQRLRDAVAPSCKGCGDK